MKKAVLIVIGVAVVAASAFVIRIGPRNAIGMLLYDQRRDGDLNVGDRAPDAQPRSLAERLMIANDFVKRFRYPLPLAVDAMDDRVEKVYAGWPERFYIIDTRGVIVYKGEPGPFGFHPEEVEAWLAKNV